MRKQHTQTVTKHKRFVVLSFGDGVNTVALLILCWREYDFVIFADTGSEKKSTYRYIEEYIIPFCETHGIQFVMVQENEILEEYMKRSGRLPAIMNRFCTKNYKVAPIQRFYRKVLGATNKHQVVEHIGFTVNEAKRIGRFAGKKYIDRQYPLLDRKITRDGCVKIIQDEGWPIPPKSACDHCFLQTKHAIRQVAAEDPERFQEIIKLEESSPRFPKYKIFGRKFSARSIIGSHSLDEYYGGGSNDDEDEDDDYYKDMACNDSNCFT